MQTQSPSTVITAHQTGISTSQQFRDTAASDWHKAGEIIAQLNSWSEVCPDYREALQDCAEEIAWEAHLELSSAGIGYKTSELKHGANQIITTLSLWSQLYTNFAQILSNCEEEIKSIAAVRERKDDHERARDIVLEAVTQGYQRSVEIADHTGLPLRRVQRALLRLVQLGLVKESGCGALRPDDGNRLRFYELTHTLP